MRPCLVSRGSSSAPSVTRIYHFIALVRGPSLGIFETEPSLNLREQNRHASLSPLFPLSALFPAHHDASPGLRILPRARIHTPPRDSRGVVLRRARRGDDENRVAAFLFERPDHDNTRTTTTTLGRHANPTRARRAAPSRHRQRIYTRHTNNTNSTNATDAHGNIEQSRWWWWWTWWAAPRVVYIYPGHQQQYPHNPYPPVQPPLVEPNCPQVSLLLQELIVRTRAISMTSSCLFYTQVTTGNGQPVRDCCCPSGCAIR